MVFSVLFVCTGNICRSPTAEGVFRHLARVRGVSDFFEVDSAGTHGFHAGEPPDPRSVFTAARRGVNITDVRARAFKKADFTRFDLILGMASEHFTYLQHRYPAGGGRTAEIGLFLDYAGLGGRDVSDPYYGSEEGFEQVFDMIEQGCSKVLDRLVRDKINKTQ